MHLKPQSDLIKEWPIVRLGEVLIPVQRTEVPMPGTTYRQIGVKLWGEGAYEREQMDGGATKYTQLFRAETEDVIVNKIWARNGSVVVDVDDIRRAEYGAYYTKQKPLKAAALKSG